MNGLNTQNKGGSCSCKSVFNIVYTGDGKVYGCGGQAAAEGGNYSLEAIVKLDNGSNYSLTWAGAPVSWGEVLVATKLNTVMHTQVNQNKTVTVKLAEAGVEFTAGQWGPQVTGGNGKYLSADGVYVPAARYSSSLKKSTERYFKQA